MFQAASFLPELKSSGLILPLLASIRRSRHLYGTPRVRHLRRAAILAPSAEARASITGHELCCVIIGNDYWTNRPTCQGHGVPCAKKALVGKWGYVE